MDFNCFVIIFILSGVLYLVEWTGQLGLREGEAELFYKAVRLFRISYRVFCIFLALRRSAF